MSYLTQEFMDGLETLKEEEMLENLANEFKSMFPSRTRVLGDENLNLFLSHQQERVKFYDYEHYEDLKRYALVAFYLGTYFDEDPFYPWVENIMKWDESFGVKVDSLMEEFQRLSEQTMGKDFNCFLEALEKFENLSPRMIENFKKYESVVDTLKYIYPERVKVVGEEILHEQLKSQNIELNQYEMHNALGAFTYLTTKFILGSFVLKDPLYTWVGKYINKTYSNDQEKSRALFIKAKSRIRREIREIIKMREVG